MPSPGMHCQRCGRYKSFSYTKLMPIDFQFECANRTHCDKPYSLWDKISLMKVGDIWRLKLAQDPRGIIDDVLIPLNEKPRLYLVPKYKNQA